MLFRLLPLLALLATTSMPAAPQLAPPTLKITADKAPRYIGRYAVVTGKVVRTHTAHHANGAPTVLNLNKEYPNCPLEVVIFADVASRLKKDPAHLVGRVVTVRGRIQAAGSTAQIVLDAPASLTF